MASLSDEWFPLWGALKTGVCPPTKGQVRWLLETIPEIRGVLKDPGAYVVLIEEYAFQTWGARRK